MVPEGPLTPEKQLLKLIEAGKNKGGHQVEKEAAKHRRLSLFSPAAWLGRFSFFKEGFGAWSAAGGLRQVNIKALNRVLALGIVALVIFFLRAVTVSLANLEKMPAADAVAPQAGASLAEEVFREPLEYYLERVRARDIFSLGILEVPQDLAFDDVERPPTSRILTATQHLSLVGISWSDDPDAMIEDSEAVRTFFVKKGDMIGDVKVEAIFKDKVVLSYFGETIELK